MKNKLWKLEMSASDPGVLELYIYGYVQGDTSNMWGETEVSVTSADYFKSELAKYPNAKQINVYVNSYGGSVKEALPMRNQLQRHPAKVTGIVDGFAASAASFILTACDEVKMYSNTMQMLHNMMGVSYGNANTHRKTADDQDAIMSGIRQAYMEKSNGKMTEEQLTEILDNDTWLNAQQCLEYGLCDEIIAKDVDMTAAKSMLAKANMSIEQHISRSNELAMIIKEINMVTPETSAVPDPPKPMTNADRLMAVFKKNQEA